MTQYTIKKAQTLLGHPLAVGCNKFVTRHKPLTQRQWLTRMQQTDALDLALDHYGSGPAIELLETKMASLLGKEKALFVHKGMLGQHSALLHWSQYTNSKTIALHPQSHLQLDEELAYQQLLGLDGIMFGKPGQAIDNEDINHLASYATKLAAITIELPVRRAGFQLPQWQTLITLKNYCNEQKTPLHIDGARLLESTQYWHKHYHQVAELADSVYISLYKILGAAAGGIIAGDSNFIEKIKPWRTRLGGDILTVFPYILTALWGIDYYLPKIPQYTQRAKKLAEKIQETL